VKLVLAKAGNGNPVFSIRSGYPLEFTPYLIRGRNDEIIDFMDRHYLVMSDEFRVMSLGRPTSV
jgi:hypothetical protein